jgi:uncharacterized protein (DUF952 family)
MSISLPTRRIVRRMTILHFCGEEDWAEAQATGEYRADSLTTEGFIHCSTADQVHLPANALAAGRTDLVLLEVEPAQITAEIRWEPAVPADPESTRFPHVYGPIPTRAVVAVHEFKPGPDGRFVAPAHLRTP